MLPLALERELRVRGHGTALRVDGVDVTASIVGNDITVDTGAGIMLEAQGDDASTISRNRIAAKAGSMAIHVASPSDTGKQRIEQNDTCTEYISHDDLAECKPDHR